MKSRPHNQMLFQSQLIKAYLGSFIPLNSLVFSRALFAKHLTKMDLRLSNILLTVHVLIIVCSKGIYHTAMMVKKITLYNDIPDCLASNYHDISVEQMV